MIPHKLRTGTYHLKTARLLRVRACGKGTPDSRDPEVHRGAGSYFLHRAMVSRPNSVNGGLGGPK
jgi:hypothetical protein